MSPFSRSFRLFLVCAGFIVLSFAGCSEPLPDGMPALHPVTLKFTQDGQPCEGASISLIPEIPSGWISGGSTDATGTAVLRTYGKYPGVPEGKYKVVVTKVVREQIGPPSESMYDFAGEAVYHLIDTVYSVPGTTTIEIEVQPGRNVFDPMELGAEIRERVRRPGE